MVPNDADICVCTDLDEVFLKGWREKLESVWRKDVNRCRYTYNWSLDENVILKYHLYMKRFIVEIIINGFIQFMKY